jgi:cytochrome b subunit of formate dehydrogenase/uncharacterized membrane protein
MADDENSCIQCHANLTEKDQVRFLVTAKDFAGDAHWQKGLRCQDCHGGDATVFEIKAHQASGDFRVPKSAEEMRKFCGTCHQAEALELVKGVHDKAGPKNELGHGTPLACGGCHGTPSHRILPARDSRSPVFLDHQVNTCGACHEDRLETYRDSVHGQGLSRMGLLVVPACADCHGAHGVYRAPDKRSSLHPSRVAATCGKCHRFIEERLAASVHGQVPGGAAEKVAPGGSGKQKPSCTACHQGHDLPAPETAAFRRQLPNRCGNCHAKLSSRYALSIHGELTELGYSPAAKCSDCHGAHDIRLVSDPHSRLAADNRLQTCQQCHAHATARFVSFDPHADYRDAQRDPLVHGVYVVLLTILLSTFGLFGLHAVLWFVRGLVEVLKTGRPRGLDPARPAYVRFSMVHRVGHSFLLVAFLGLALTGLPLKYSHAPWAKVVAQAWGGFASTGFWHRVFALVVFGCFASYMVRLVRQFLAGRRRGESLLDVVFGPDSPVPNFRDLRDCFAMLRWFLGLGPKPGFERWAYWEKLDFWGAAADIVIIGFTGLVLWFPNFFCRFLPGRVLNIAQVVHSTQALLATGFVFAIHFFNTHLRPDKFPADMSVMTGRISEDEFRDERPAFFDRLRRQGGLEAIRATSPGYKALWLIRALGMLAMVAGLALLAGMVAAGLSD